MFNPLSLILFDALGAKWSYYISFVVLALTVPTIIVLSARYLWPWLYGQPLAGWVERRRCDPTEEETHQLSTIRKILGTLAHDVLKHRLLGLISLIQSLDAAELAEQQESSDVPKEGDDPAWAIEEELAGDAHRKSERDWGELRQELLRLCGARAAPRDRLWARWSEAFVEARRIAGGRIVPPWGDRRFQRTDRTLKRLRKMVRAFVAGERESALSPDRIRVLGLTQLGDVHGEILSIAEGCRPVIDVEKVVGEGLSALGALVGRRGAAERVTCHIDVDETFLADAPPRVIATCLERLLDNALRLSPEEAPIEVRVEVEHDDLFGDEVLVFRVLDVIAHIPDREHFGSGLRELQRALAEYDCGVSFESLDGSQPPFFKEARLTLPVTRCEPLPSSHRALAPLRLVAPVLLLLVLISSLATTRILGGAPVQFSGLGNLSGEPVVEFRTRVDQELQFKLCEGGSEPNAEVKLEHEESCIAPECSLAEVIKGLEPCGERLARSDCPGVFRWTPSFEEGSRQGKEYELSVTCRAPGPPESEDHRRIRLVVSRRNTPPNIEKVELEGEDGASVLLDKDGPVKLNASTRLVLVASATDDDEDPLQFRLYPGHSGPKGADLPEHFKSRDGRFIFDEIPWSDDGFFNATLEVDDGIDPPVRQALVFEATQLHRTELRSLKMQVLPTTKPVSCVGGHGEGAGLATSSGSGGVMICQLGEQKRYQLTFGVWFDPLLGQVEENITISADKSDPIRVVSPLGSALAPRQPQLSQTWRLQARRTKQPLAKLELTEVSDDLSSGEELRYYTMELKLDDINTLEMNNWFLRFKVEESSGRTEHLDFVLVLSRLGQGNRLSTTPSRVQLYEFERDGDRDDARKSVQVMLYDQGSTSRKLAPAIVECNRAELASAFETSITPLNLHQGGAKVWQLDIELKQGCIEGLGGAGSPFASAEARTCYVRLNTSDRKDHASVEVRLKDRFCRPRITKVAAANPDDLPSEGEEALWVVEVSDPDGDLDPEEVTLLGADNFDLTMTRAQGSATRLHGRVEGKVQCGEAGEGIVVQVRDQSGFTTTSPLEMIGQCAPSVATVDGKDRFEVQEGDLLKVPLRWTEDAMLSMEDGVGLLNNGVFLWKASCEQGPGPHNIEIHAKKNGEFSEPLFLEVVIPRCRVRVYLEERGVALAGDKLYRLPTFSTRVLRVIPEMSRPRDLEISAHLEPPGVELSVKVADRGREDIFHLRCRKNSETRDLVITARPKARIAGRFLPSTPLRIPVRCFND